MLVLTLDICRDDSLRWVLSRLAGRLLTGPLAFLAAGVTDFLIYGVKTLQAARRSRRPSTISPR
jgi:hypothetical protein